VVKEAIFQLRKYGKLHHYASCGWIFWRERNGKCFEDQERSMEELKKLLIQTLFHWADAFSVPQFSTMSQFLSLCSSFCL
jgi:hypothetical protein